ncbi:MAG TPA: DUF4159 domain-containing protein [Pyrinomonadaceae bacterium]|nr:DUF4159 domain-containing protein [Pyrinomonadaceae bacterium]
MTNVSRRSSFGSWRLFAAAVTILFILILSGPAQPTRPPARPPSNNVGTSGEFTFVRIKYDSPHSPYNYGFGGAWRVDFPEADEHFMSGIREWVGTNLRLSGGPVQLRATDERLFDYPFAYIVEPGHMELSNEDAAALREYLLRGGFLFLDDFHGEVEWQRARAQLKMIFPEYEVKDLPLTHPIFHSYFDLDGVVQVPGWAALIHGVTYERDGVTPHYMGVEDRNGRLMIFLTRNCDLGDAWEWINDSHYPIQYGVVAYKVAINVVIYAMTH